jgi:hypothetical protein
MTSLNLYISIGPKTSQLKQLLEGVLTDLSLVHVDLGGTVVNTNGWQVFPNKPLLTVPDTAFYSVNEIFCSSEADFLTFS